MLLYKNVGTCTIFLEFKLLLSDVSKFQRKNLYQNQEELRKFFLIDVLNLLLISKDLICNTEII